MLFKRMTRKYIPEKAMAPHSSTFAWKIPWMEEPRRLQSMGSLRVGHDWATSLSLFTFMHWRKNGNPLQYSCLENPRGRGAWWAAVYGVTQSWMWLKWLSSRKYIQGSLAGHSISWCEVNKFWAFSIILTHPFFHKSQKHRLLMKLIFEPGCL